MKGKKKLHTEGTQRKGEAEKKKIQNKRKEVNGRKRQSDSPKPTPDLETRRRNVETKTKIKANPSLKSRLRNGETMYGLFLLSFSPTFAEIAGLSGYDFVLAAFPTLSRLHVLAATPPLPPP